MERSEEKQLEDIIQEFSRGVQAFKKRDCQSAVEIFDGIIDQYKDSEYYGVMEVKTRAVVYKNISQSILNPITPDLNNDIDNLNDGLYHLNAGNLDKAQERFNYLAEKKFQDPFLDYLMALMYAKKDDQANCLEHLRVAIEKDEVYKIIAHNDRDFDKMFENEDFVHLINAD